MARFSISEVLDLVGLSDSDSSEEEGDGVCAYRGKHSVDSGEVLALAQAVSNDLPETAGPSALDSEDEFLIGGRDDFEGENKL